MKRSQSSFCALLCFLALSCTHGSAPSNMPQAQPRKEASDAPFELIIDDITPFIQKGYRTAERTPDDIDIIVIHSNNFLGVDSFSTEGCLQQFEAANVSPHYMITREGIVIQMVKEKDIAWHAGESILPGTDRRALNASSIGIEIVNTQSEEPTPHQYKALLELCQQLTQKWGIRYIVRHSDIAPDRKTDPWLLDWDQFEHDLKERVSEDLLFPRK